MRTSIQRHDAHVQIDPMQPRRMESVHGSRADASPVLVAFNEHDLDSIMSHFAEDCVFETPRGPDRWGRRFVGKEEVRRGLAARFEGIPDVHYGDDDHFACGDRGVSEGRSAARPSTVSTSTSAAATFGHSTPRARSLARTASGRSARRDEFGSLRRS